MYLCVFYIYIGRSRYRFYLAFENTNEEGYVTEKVYDALDAGTNYTQSL